MYQTLSNFILAATLTSLNRSKFHPIHLTTVSPILPFTQTNQAYRAALPVIASKSPFNGALDAARGDVDNFWLADLEELALRLALKELYAQEHRHLAPVGYQLDGLPHELQGVTERRVCNDVAIVLRVALQEVNIRRAIAAVDKVGGRGKLAVSGKHLARCPAPQVGSLMSLRSDSTSRSSSAALGSVA